MSISVEQIWNAYDKSDMEGRKADAQRDKEYAKLMTEYTSANRNKLPPDTKIKYLEKNYDPAHSRVNGEVYYKGEGPVNFQFYAKCTPGDRVFLNNTSSASKSFVDTAQNRKIEESYGKYTSDGKAKKLQDRLRPSKVKHSGGIMTHINTIPAISKDELAHYGIQGIKWGVRRYQNPDGTLTGAGKKRNEKLASKQSDSVSKVGSLMSQRSQAIVGVEKYRIEKEIGKQLDKMKKIYVSELNKGNTEFGKQTVKAIQDKHGKDIANWYKAEMKKSK